MLGTLGRLDASATGEFTYTHLSSNLATGGGSFFVTLGKGDTQAVKEVSVAIGQTGAEWGSGGYVELHRANSGLERSGSSSTIQSRFFLQNQSTWLADMNSWSTGSVYVYVDHNAGASKDVQLTVRYLYK
jgi:hypothetical protein